MAEFELFNIEEELAKNTKLINEALDLYLPNESCAHSIIYDAMRYSALDGGKRIRPFLTLEFCRMMGGDITAALPYACAVECIHTYSLIHDDLPCMDNDDYRRGKPTSHKKFGEANALLAGDALLTLSFGIASGNPFASAAQNASAVNVLANAAGCDGMIGGQVTDIAYAGRAVTFDELLASDLKKTGELIDAACKLGLIAAGVTDSDVEFGVDVDGNAIVGHELFRACTVYSYNVGLAFQFVDDVLDGESGEDSDGTTVLAHVTADEALAQAAEMTNNAVSAIGRFGRSERLAALAKYLLSRNA